VTDHELIQMLVRHEGVRLKVYTCPAGKLTIGVGRNLEDAGISEGEAMHMLHSDIASARRKLEANIWYTQLNSNRQAVIINMVINMGYKRFLGFKHMILALAKQDYKKASEEMLNSKWAAQVKGRATELAEMMLKGVSPDSRP